MKLSISYITQTSDKTFWISLQKVCISKMWMILVCANFAIMSCSDTRISPLFRTASDGELGGAWERGYEKYPSSKNTLWNFPFHTLWISLRKVCISKMWMILVRGRWGLGSWLKQFYIKQKGTCYVVKRMLMDSVNTIIAVWLSFSKNARYK